MRLPHPFLESPLFQFTSVDEVIAALGTHVTERQLEQIRYLSGKGLPPIVSAESLAVMLGINPGIIWSFTHRTHRYYRAFELPKGRGTRQILAPKVALKIIQAWISFHIARHYDAPAHVFGFVPGRSHIQAANAHVGATWAFSVDIADFFPSTSATLVREAYHGLGYDLGPAELLTSLSCLNGWLPQGAPTSPPLSNICFAKMDVSLQSIAARYDAILTRYADDIVFSGTGVFPSALRDEVHELFSKSPWQLAPHKESLEPIKGRIKVHGLLVSGGRVRLTKGYRNRIRAYRHILQTRGSSASDLPRLRGHLAFAEHVLQEGAQPHSRQIPTPLPSVTLETSHDAESEESLLARLLEAIRRPLSGPDEEK